jgi:hypothetical protein
MAVSAVQTPARAFTAVFGVDFSGARLAGRTTWIARLDPAASPGEPAFTLGALDRLDRLAGTAERDAALAHLVERVAQTTDALWAFDFPFGLPVELFPARSRWPRQLALVREYRADDYGLGLECVRRARAIGERMHIRRQTDVDARAPFDPYHYRIIYQTFHGMRDVLGPLRPDSSTAILPFHYDRRRAARVLTEACPASTLKRLNLPHQNYKQANAGPLTAKRRRTRRIILAGLESRVRITPRQRRVIMSDNGGDALDAVLAAVGVLRSWQTTDHRRVARHHLYVREGRLYV